MAPLSRRHSSHNQAYNYSGMHPFSNGQPINQYYPPVPQQYAPLAQRTIHIYTSKPGRIMDADKHTPLYHYETHKSKKPHIRLNNSYGMPIGSATFHSFSSRIDLVLHGVPIKFSSNGTFHSGHHMPSRFAAGGTLKWKSKHSLSSDRICIDGQGRELARFETSNWAIGKEGKLHLIGPATAGPGGFMDEIILGALADMVNQHRTAEAAAEAGGAAGGAGA